ncbi:thymidylate kinase [Thermosipho sp. 1063]|uniref:dTMP kinase n=1 Tax=unclassified Thermosipho (in: thermotogales) TaxID=2676525 RepID=UPI000949361D|nr:MULTISPECIES: dTMP kinase [unclassified Thermosipho (in: thermotogales)]ANQ53866.1 thymidylate kinase [Thermosipho sp. 1070]APT72313.1 thymidylate kinase [Thermosipho sp. 1063]OOC43557.1 thymidylate kinase [Thermosipho sp. 1074]
MFITFEGIDGSGKSTQLDLLANYLEQKNKKVIKVREPGGTILGEKIRDLLLNFPMNSRSELLLFLASRAQLVDEIIKPSLKKGYFVLADRFTDSSIAYQGGARNLGIDLVEYLNSFATDNILPNIVFFIDVPVNIAITRILKKDRIEREGKNFLEKVRDTYLKISMKKDNFYVIDGNQDVEGVFLQIKNIVDSYLDH